MIQNLIRIAPTLRARGVGRTSHYKDISSGLFTKPVMLGRKLTGWPEHEIYAINNARIAGKSEAEIRALVCQLHIARQKVGPDSSGGQL